MSPTITSAQGDTLVRGLSLMGRHDVLAPFEAGLLRDCIERFNVRGDRTVLTANEWRVNEEAVGALDAAQADHMARINAAASEAA